MSALKKILVVDDDSVIGKSFDRVLSGKGYAVITAASGEEALRKLSTETYDVVFTDIKMPGMSGMEVARRVKASRPWLPVVIVTGHGSPADEARAEELGVCEFVHKPLSPKTIEGSTEKALLEHATAHKVKEAVAVTEPAVAEEKAGSHLKDIALFFAAPFIGLAYLLASPFVGLGMLVWFAGKAIMKNRVAKAVALTIAAPLIALGFVLFGPIAGLGVLAWIGGKAALKA